MFQEEQSKREEIMRKSNDERLLRDQSRRLEIQRQEQLLSGRVVRAKTEGLEAARGGGIQVYHYKDPGQPATCSFTFVHGPASFPLASFTCYLFFTLSCFYSSSCSVSEVETIVRNTNKEEIMRRMSHGELLRDFSKEQIRATPVEQEGEKQMFFNAQVNILYQRPAAHCINDIALS